MIKGLHYELPVAWGVFLEKWTEHMLNSYHYPFNVVMEKPIEVSDNQRLIVSLDDIVFDNLIDRVKTTPSLFEPISLAFIVPEETSEISKLSKTILDQLYKGMMDDEY